jgi:hypothetical protein
VNDDYYAQVVITLAIAAMCGSVGDRRPDLAESVLLVNVKA